MLGNGLLPAAEDAGNLIILSGSSVTAGGIAALSPWALGGLGVLFVGVGSVAIRRR